MTSEVMNAMACQAPTLAPDAGTGTHIAVRPAFPVPVLATGGDLKNTVCSALGHDAWISDPLEDLAHPECHRLFARAVQRIRDAHQNAPPVVAHDLHPLYHSTRFAKRVGCRCLGVQHHHAHGVSSAIDADLRLPVVAIVCDGTGFGTDGRSWGGEVLICDAVAFRRSAHLDYFALPGGDVAARETWRPAVALLDGALPGGWRELGLRALEPIDPVELSVVCRQIAMALNAPLSSSVGRLFDAVAFLTGVCSGNETEGQAAVAVEAAATDAFSAGRPVRPYEFELVGRNASPSVIDWRPLIRAIVSNVLSGQAPSSVCARFHLTLARMFAESAIDAAHRTGINRVVLSGGCMNNTLLREGLRRELTQAGCAVGTHSRVSCGDAGLSLGQAMVASATVALGPSPEGGLVPCA